MNSNTVSSDEENMEEIKDIKGENTYYEPKKEEEVGDDAVTDSNSKLSISTDVGVDKKWICVYYDPAIGLPPNIRSLSILKLIILSFFLLIYLLSFSTIYISLLSHLSLHTCLLILLLLEYLPL